MFSVTDSFERNHHPPESCVLSTLNVATTHRQILLVNAWNFEYMVLFRLLNIYTGWSKLGFKDRQRQISQGELYLRNIGCNLLQGQTLKYMQIAFYNAADMISIADKYKKVNVEQ